MFIYLHLLPAIIPLLKFLSKKFRIDGSHIDRICEFLFLHLAPLYIIAMIDLFLEFIAQQILHFSLSIDYVLRNLLVFFWTEMCLRRLLDVLFVYFTTHLVHLDLLMQNFANRMLLLLPLHIACHLESIVLLFECL